MKRLRKRIQKIQRQKILIQQLTQMTKVEQATIIATSQSLGLDSSNGLVSCGQIVTGEVVLTNDPIVVTEMDLLQVHPGHIST